MKLKDTLLVCGWLILSTSILAGPLRVPDSARNYPLQPGRTTRLVGQRYFPDYRSP